MKISLLLRRLFSPKITWHIGHVQGNSMYHVNSNGDAFLIDSNCDISQIKTGLHTK